MNRDAEAPADDRLIADDASSLYEEAPCGYLYTRPDGVLLRVNRTFLAWTGFERHEVIGRRFQDLLSIGGRIFHETHFAPLLHMQGFVNEIALDVVTKSGALLPVLVNSVQKRNADGTPVLNRTTVFNATDRKKYERELQEARRRAEESARGKSELLSTISHDIRSPLGAILAAAQLLERSGLTPAQQTYVRVLRSSSESLLNLVNDVLDLSRIESGRAALERRPFDLRQLVLDVLTTLNVRAEEKQLALRVAIGEAVPPAVLGDPVKLGQILTNLVANAVKFTERGSVAVSIGVKGSAGDRVELEFGVADTGIGIPADRLPHIFEEFTQASSEVGATYGGSGLGLAIVRRLLALHGSEITVESAVNQGSIFRFTIGFDVVDAARAASADIGSNEAIAESALLSGLRALIVDDNSFEAFVLGRALASWDVRYDVCPTVADAADTLRRSDYGAVLLSARLAEGEVNDAAARLQEAARAAGSGTQVLVLARPAGEAAAVMSGGGIADVIQKPVDTSVLFAKLASLKR